MRPALLAALLAAGACRRAATEANYRHCLTLQLGMTREQLFQTMGPPAETEPYVEGKSLPQMKGLTAYEWPNGGPIVASNYASVEEATGRVRSLRCADAVITASVDGR